MILPLLVACADDPVPGASPPVGALGDGPLNPFPSVELIDAGGFVAIPEGTLPMVEGGTPMDVSRLTSRTGFSPVQPAVARLPVAVDEESLGGSTAIGVGGTVRVIDLDSGEEVPCFAELDADAQALESGERTLIVRPMRAMTTGHRVAIVLTRAVTAGGAPLDLGAPEGHYAELHAELAALGVDDVALAWDFPVGDGTAVTRALAAAAGVPGAWTFDRTWDADGDTEPVAGAWRQAEGSFTTDNWLVDDVAFEIGGDGLPTPQGTVEAYLFVHVPERVREMAPGTAPVLVFGHGILGEPDDYLAEDDDPSNVIRLAEELGAIVVATTWRGLTVDDQLRAVEVANDFGRFSELTDLLAQGVANTVALVRLVDEGGLLDDPFFEGRADRSRLYYYGISLGSIEGAVMLANQDAIGHAVLHVGGAAWATMLERSSHWPRFQFLVERGIPDPADRQLLYATTQLYWDAVDPSSYADDLRGRAFLWQEAIHDEQVPNLTTELLMRSAGVPLGTPAVTAPYGVDTVALPATAPAFTQFDPETEPPPATNTPPGITGAHAEPRTWEQCLQQTVAFFAEGAEGQVTHHCGEGACTASSIAE